jgi:hypothetical protein
LKKQRKKPITPLFPASSAPATAVEDQNPLIIIHKAAIHFNPKLFSRIASVFTFAGRKKRSYRYHRLYPRDRVHHEGWPWLLALSHLIDPALGSSHISLGKDALACSDTSINRTCSSHPSILILFLFRVGGN